MRNIPTQKNNWLLTGISCLLAFLLLLMLHVALSGSGSGGSGQVDAGSFLPSIVAQTDQNVAAAGLLNGRVPSLSWIVGRDCASGLQAYLQHASTNPDAALVGTGWLDPTTGRLIAGQSNNCVPGSLSMDSVIEQVHRHSGKAYLTITMQTDGSATSWTTAQQTAYLVQAVQTPDLSAPVIEEMERGGYDGIVMDLEGTDAFYPRIQQLFATYNQQLWHTVQSLHRLYGIALIHKLSGHDEYASLNGFENWNLLGRSADFLVVMAVDQSYWTPGPSVSVPWLEHLLAYVRQTMPQMLPHIIWELPLYGNTWHQAGGRWVFDGIITYQDAMHILDGVALSRIDQSQSKRDDPYQPHLVYTDTSGVRQALWFMTALSLRNIMHDFQQVLRTEARGTLQFAIWWSTTAEPPDFWADVNTLYA
jgi:spore germination protein YaaH